MEISTNLTTGITDNTALSNLPPINATTTNPTTKTEESGLSDQLDLSDSSQMLSTAMTMAEDGDKQATAFLDALEKGLETGNIDLEQLLIAAPGKLTESLASSGIDIESALQTFVNYAKSMASMPSLTSAESTETKTKP